MSQQTVRYIKIFPYSVGPAYWFKLVSMAMRYVKTGWCLSEDEYENALAVWNTRFKLRHSLSFNWCVCQREAVEK